MPRRNMLGAPSDSARDGTIASHISALLTYYHRRSNCISVHANTVVRMQRRLRARQNSCIGSEWRYDYDSLLLHAWCGVRGVEGTICVQCQFPERSPGQTMESHAVAPAKKPRLIWDDDRPAAANYKELGALLASGNDLFCRPGYGNGLVLLIADGKHAVLTRGADLLPVIVDRIEVEVIRNGKRKGTTIDATHLNSMLRSDSFLRSFCTADLVTSEPVYLHDFSVAERGFNDGEPGQRIVYTGRVPQIMESHEAIDSFLDVMAFESNADRTNAVAAALTVLFRNHWLGGKPIILATATKSHAGKDTVIAFATGTAKSVAISYQSTAWRLNGHSLGH